MDAVAVTGGVEGQKYEKCLELMNLMASADVLTALSVQNGDPQYLLPARKAPIGFCPPISRVMPNWKSWPALRTAMSS